jgi:hypothetical protein
MAGSVKHLSRRTRHATCIRGDRMRWFVVGVIVGIILVVWLLVSCIGAVF